MTCLTADTITDGQIRELFEQHCECRPVDVDRRSHSHDCDDDIVEDCRVALGGKPDGQFSPRSTYTAIIQTRAARVRCASIINSRASLTADTITDEQIVEATAFDLRLSESNAELIQLRARALRGQGRGDDVTEETRQNARARCVEILNARTSK